LPDATNRVVHAAHRNAVTDQQGISLELLVVVQAPHFVLQALMLRRARDAQAQLLFIDRLGQEVVCTGAQGVHGELHVRVPRDREDRRVTALCDQLLAKLEAVHRHHAEVRHHDGVTLVLGMLERLLRRRCRGHAVAQAHEHASQQFAVILIVVDEKDVISHGVSCGSRRF